MKRKLNSEEKEVVDNQNPPRNTSSKRPFYTNSLSTENIKPELVKAISTQNDEEAEIIENTIKTILSLLEKREIKYAEKLVNTLSQKGQNTELENGKTLYHHFIRCKVDYEQDMLIQTERNIEILLEKDRKSRAEALKREFEEFITKKRDRGVDKRSTNVFSHINKDSLGRINTNSKKETDKANSVISLLHTLINNDSTTKYSIKNSIKRIKSKKGIYKDQDVVSLLRALINNESTKILPPLYNNNCVDTISEYNLDVYREVLRNYNSIKKESTSNDTQYPYVLLPIRMGSVDNYHWSMAILIKHSNSNMMQTIYYNPYGYLLEANKYFTELLNEIYEYKLYLDIDSINVIDLQAIQQLVKDDKSSGPIAVQIISQIMKYLLENQITTFTNSEINNLCDTLKQINIKDVSKFRKNQVDSLKEHRKILKEFKVIELMLKEQITTSDYYDKVYKFLIQINSKDVSNKEKIEALVKFNSQHLSKLSKSQLYSLQKGMKYLDSEYDSSESSECDSSESSECDSSEGSEYDSSKDSKYDLLKYDLSENSEYDSSESQLVGEVGK